MLGRSDLAMEKTEGKKVRLIEEKIYKESRVLTFETGSGESAEKHITVAFESLLFLTDQKPVLKAVRDGLSALLGDKNSFLVAGLGNMEITADSLGPRTASALFATRHIPSEIIEKLGVKGLKKVSVICPSVLGKTGMEAAELIEAAVEKIKPEAVIVIDALAAAEYSRIFTTIQLSSAGICPGSGVKNSRAEISRKTLGIPVAAVGVPTVTDMENILGKGNNNGDSGLIVTPKDCDILCKKMSELLAGAINEFLQPQLDPKLISELV